MLRIILPLVISAFLWISAPHQAQAEQFQIISKQSEFLSLVNGKILTVKTPFFLRNAIRLTVRRNGEIQGSALRYGLTGNWSWQGGYFCREMDWSGTPIPYNCQQVEYNGDRVRFVSDRGTGANVIFSID